MTLTQPLMLAGLLGIAAPVIIHLLNRARRRPVRWAAMRFLAAAIQRNRRHLQVADLLLLLLRCLVVAFLALAFARPVWKAAHSAAGEGAVSLAVVVDASGSMLESDGVRTRWELARIALDEEIARLPAGSTATLFLARDDVRAVIAEPTADLGLLSRSLERPPSGVRSSDLHPAIARAATTLHALGGRREVLVITDGQALGWSRLGQIEAALTAPSGETLPLRVIQVGDAPGDNLAITALEPGSTVAARGRRLPLRVTVANYASTPATGIRVTAGLEGAPPSAEAVIPELRAGQSRTVDLAVRPAEPGFTAVTATLGRGDRLPWDDSRSAGLQVVEQLDVLVVEGDRSGPDAPRPGFFLTAALAPPGSDRSAEDAPVRVVTVPAGALPGRDLAAFRAIFLCHVPALDPATLGSLPGWVARGGGLVVFPGPGTDTARLGSALGLAGLLPAPIAPAAVDLREQPVSLQSTGYRHPLVAPWNDAAFGTLATARFHRIFPLDDPGPGDASRVILRFADGRPAVVERPVGLGRVVLFSSGVTPPENDLPLRPAFVPFVSRLLEAVAGGSAAALTLRAGEPLLLALGPENLRREVRVLRPGEDGPPRLAGRVESTARGPTASVRDTDTPGVYRIVIGDLDSRPYLVAVQPPPAESDLRRLPGSSADRLATLASSRETAAAGTSATPATATSSPGWPARDIDFWTPAIVLVLALAAAEAFAARSATEPR